MKYIKKSIRNEPSSLKEKRSTPGATYDDCNKNDIRQALLIEQGYLCAYCMKRINNKKNTIGLPNTRIEHFEAQSMKEELRMNYLNMLGVCDGREGKNKHLQTCDKRRGNQALTIDPRKKNCEQLIAYRDNGTIYSTNPKIDLELNDILGLNIDTLVVERIKVIQFARKRVQKLYKKNKKDQPWSKGDLAKEIKFWNSKSADKYTVYCMTAIYYLEKKLARL